MSAPRIGMVVAGIASAWLALGLSHANEPLPTCIAAGGRPDGWLQPEAVPEACMAKAPNEQDSCIGGPDPEALDLPWHGSYQCADSDALQAPAASIAVRFAHYGAADIWLAVPRAQLAAGRYEAYGATPIFSTTDPHGGYAFDATGQLVATAFPRSLFRLYLSFETPGALSMFADGKTPKGFEKTDGEREGLTFYRDVREGAHAESGFLVARETPWGLVAGDCSTTVTTIDGERETTRYQCSLGWKTGDGLALSVTFFDSELKDWRKIVGSSTEMTAGWHSAARDYPPAADRP